MSSDRELLIFVNCLAVGCSAIYYFASFVFIEMDKIKYYILIMLLEYYIMEYYILLFFFTFYLQTSKYHEMKERCFDIRFW